ncbi:MAG: FtsX-like permease family protein [Bacteroidota bacterium]
MLGKKSTNAINIITWVSMLGVAIGTAALILILTVFNGFEELISNLVNSFNPDIKVIPAKGKTFDPETFPFEKLGSIEGVQAYSKTLEEIALFEYDESQDFGSIKGVDENFVNVSGVDSTLREGIFKLKNKEQALAVVGAGIGNELAINIDDEFNPISVYMPKQTSSTFDKPFRIKLVYPVGTFSIQRDFDYEYVFTSLEFVQSLLNKGNQISAVEIKTNPLMDVRDIRKEVASLLGEQFVVKDRFQQDEAFLKLMNIERWMSYAVTMLTFLIVAFNLIGTIWMIVLDKRKDISILKSMGAQETSIIKVFLNQGILICGLGMAIGFFFSILIYVLHKQFGIIPIPEGFIVDIYPAKLKFTDFLIVSVTVMIIGILASLGPSLNAAKMPAIFKEEV